MSETGCSTVLMPWVEDSVMVAPDVGGWCRRGKTNGRARNRQRRLGEPPVLDDRGPVERQTAAVAQVADQVPVDRRLVRPARLRIRAPQREVHRPADLLVEED